MHSLQIRPTAQRGIATVLILLLTGLSLTAAVLGTVYYVRGTQEQGVSAHAATQAQLKAWTGVEAIQLYLTTLSSDEVRELTAGSLNSALQTALGGRTDIEVKAVVWQDSAKQLVVDVKGKTAEGTRAQSTSTVQVVYAVAAGTGGAQQCSNVPKAALVFNGSVDYSGGSMEIVTSESKLDSIAVNGLLTIGSGSSAKVSGCTKDDVNLSGGGVADGAELYSEGSISIASMTPPVRADLWGKSVSLSQDQGTYTGIRAGAFNAALTAGSVTGTTVVGGIKQADGTIIPPTTGLIVITLSDGSKFLLNLKNTSVNNGTITQDGSAERLSGSGTLPTTFRLSYSSLYGGGITLKQSKVDLLWGGDVAITGWDGTYTTLKAYGDVNMYHSTMGTITGGGNFYMTNNGNPTISDSGVIAGKSYAAGVLKTFPKLQTDVAGTSPGLPGVPYCDARVDTINVAGMQDQANYVFYFDQASGDPMLKIQNVNRSSDKSAVGSGPYNLKNDSFSIAGVSYKSLMLCNNGNDGCGKSATRAAGWDLTGMKKFPAGVFWFEGKVTLNGVDIGKTISTGERGNAGTKNALIGTIMSTDKVTLGSNSAALAAPNFVAPSDVCDGTFYPANLCDKTATPSKFQTWKDSGGNSHTGMPIGNMAILTDGALDTSGWYIKGNVILGKDLLTSGAVTTVVGAMTVGANQVSRTTISQGGIKIVRTGVDADQDYVPGKNCNNTPAAGTTARVLWSRYL
ncbi:hypothetical protein BJP62_09610 [Jeongeupia sp. USM3]|nr:hypothetical protein BJP62_09610 [Jeongeupia sp. USM3]